MDTFKKHLIFSVPPAKPHHPTNPTHFVITWIHPNMKAYKTYLPFGLILFLSIGLTLASLKYVQPASCLQLCDLPKQAACPVGSCRLGEQRAGFPLPMIIDSGAGSSPTSGWGKLGPEDLPNPFTPLLNVLFYGILLWLVWKLIRWLFRGERLGHPRTITTLLLVEVALLAVGYLLKP
jgi:hypothetical protein